VPRKSLNCRIKGVTFIIVMSLLGLYAVVGEDARAPRVETPAARLGHHDLPDSSKYLGAVSCASSGCHGGAGQHQNQSLVWSLRDFHSQRPFATLTTARSKQIADALRIKDPAVDNRCTSCHAPLHDVPSTLRGPGFQVSEAVSCESCHGPAERWLRSHTRPDYTHADRVATGMRDLRNLYVRANTCVACHQTLAQPLLKAGHPELIFELDGQCVSQPKHWREKTNWHGAQAWLVGQAAALREMCWQLSGGAMEGSHPALDERLIARADALLWLLQKLDAANQTVPKLSIARAEGVNAKTDYSGMRSAADKLARSASDVSWSAEITSSVLSVLARAAPDFRTELSAQQHALRAERLVLALDRLLASSPRTNTTAETELDELFKLTQSGPDFDPARFSEAMEKLARALDVKGP
jgi:hypothetical protein